MTTEETSEPGSGSGRPLHNRKLERPWIVRKLCRELALSNKTQTLLATEYGVAQSSMTEFKQRHADEINAIRDDASNEFAGLWIAEKQNRIKVYERQLDGIQHMLSTADPDQIPALLKVAQAGLKSVAEEMGQLTARVAVQADVTAKVQYVVEGLDPEDLK